MSSSPRLHLVPAPASTPARAPLRGRVPSRPGLLPVELAPGQAVDLLADWLVAYGNYQALPPLPEALVRRTLAAPSSPPGRPVFANLMRAAGVSPLGESRAEVV